MSAPELKPCPFCGAALRYAEPVAYFHPIGKCILSGRTFHKGVIGQWNRRAPDPDLDLAKVEALESANSHLSYFVTRLAQGKIKHPQMEARHALDKARAALADLKAGDT
jgi:hypothetical protein